MATWGHFASVFRRAPGQRPRVHQGPALDARLIPVSAVVALVQDVYDEVAVTCPSLPLKMKGHGLVFDDETLRWLKELTEVHVQAYIMGGLANRCGARPGAAASVAGFARAPADQEGVVRRRARPIPHPRCRGTARGGKATAKPIERARARQAPDSEPAPASTPPKGRRRAPEGTPVATQKPVKPASRAAAAKAPAKRFPLPPSPGTPEACHSSSEQTPSAAVSASEADEPPPQKVRRRLRIESDSE